MPISKMFLSLFDVPKARFLWFETAQVTQLNGNARMARMTCCTAGLEQ